MLSFEDFQYWDALIELDESQRIVKIDSKGNRRVKIQCKPGFTWTGTKCVAMSGAEKVAKKKAIRKAVRSRKMKGAGAKKRTVKLRNRAMKRRKQMGTATINNTAL